MEGPASCFRAVPGRVAYWTVTDPSTAELGISSGRVLARFLTVRSKTVAPPVCRSLSTHRRGRGSRR